MLAHKRLVGERGDADARVLLRQSLVQPVEMLEAALDCLLHTTG